MSLKLISLFMSKAVKYIFISLGIIAGWALWILGSTYLSADRAGILSVPWMYYILTRQVALFAGIALLLVRLFKWIRPQSLPYILAGTLNGCIGLLAIALYLSGHANQEWLNTCLYNLLLGTVMLGDTFVFSTADTTKTIG